MFYMSIMWNLISQLTNLVMNISQQKNMLKIIVILKVILILMKI